MYRLLVWSSKGGVGKTTSVANLGPALARRGNGVLLVGFDAHQPDLEMTVDDMARGHETGYINVSTFGKPGQAAAEILTTGWLVAVDGRLEYHEWEKDGKTRHDYELVGAVEFLAAPRRDATTSAAQPPVEAAA